jgi:hypothetical protein
MQSKHKKADKPTIVIEIKTKSISKQKSKPTPVKKEPSSEEKALKKL